MTQPPSFDAETLVLLSAAYDKVVTALHGKGQCMPDPAIVAKHIIGLASEGERDPDKLCQGALARLAA